MKSRIIYFIIIIFSISLTGTCKKNEISTKELLKQFQGTDYRKKTRAAEMLMYRKHPEAKVYFQKLFIKGDFYQKLRAAKNLGPELDNKSLKVLLKMLTYDSPYTKRSLKFHLDPFEKSNKTFEMIIRKIKLGKNTKTDKKNEAIVRVLGYVKSKDSLPYIVALLNSDFFNVRHAAKYALVNIGLVALPLLEKEYKRFPRHPLHGSTIIMETLGAYKNKKTIPLLIKGLGDSNFFARIEAKKGLIALGSVAKPHVKKALKSDNERVRKQAKEVFKKIKYKFF